MFSPSSLHVKAKSRLSVKSYRPPESPDLNTKIFVRTPCPAILLSYTRYLDKSAAWQTLVHNIKNIVQVNERVYTFYMSFSCLRNFEICTVKSCERSGGRLDLQAGLRRTVCLRLFYKLCCHHTSSLNDLSTRNLLEA